MNPADAPVSFSTLATEPVYNVKAVCKRTGLTAATLRAWERRYGLPQPNRSDQGYRLYSERDIAILFWLRRQIENGVSIAHAVHHLESLLGSGHDPSVTIPPLPAQTTNSPRSPDVLRDEIVQALIDLDERAAEHLLSEALAIYTLETALISILQSAVRTVRELHHDGKIPTTTQHLALNYIHQRLLNMAQTLPSARHLSKSVITVGFSAEHNEIDLLILAILLRRQGIPVTYLGSDLEPKMLEHALDHLNARLVIFYADDPKHVIQLVGFEMPRTTAADPVRIMCCGRALEIAPELKVHIACEYLGSDLREVLHIVMNAMLDTPPIEVS